MVSPEGLERAYRTVSIGTFVASFGFAAGLVTQYLTRTNALSHTLPYLFIAPFLTLYLASWGLLAWTAAAFVGSGERAKVKGLLRPSRWVFAGHLSVIVQTALIAV